MRWFYFLIIASVCVHVFTTGTCLQDSCICTFLLT